VALICRKENIEKQNFSVHEEIQHTVHPYWDRGNERRHKSNEDSLSCKPDVKRRKMF
jgi:hypothetical protein